MSPIFTINDTNKWVTNTIKLPEELDALVEGYRETHGLKTKSAAIRELIGVALGGDLVVEAVVRANAEAMALRLLSDAVDDAVIEFREALKAAK